MLALGVVAPHVHLATLNGAQKEDQVSGEDFLAWVQESAIKLDTLEWRSVDLNELSDLDKLLEGKRIVFLGEPDHYVREKYDFQLFLSAISLKEAGAISAWRWVERMASGLIGTWRPAT
jgi:hypothetical protein